MTAPLSFPYYATPFSDGCFVLQHIICDVCGQPQPWAYTGVFYAAEEPQHLCPWCIADGRAAKQFAGEFQDVLFSEHASPASIEAVLTQTPNVSTWNPIHWPDHCGECCQYLGDVTEETALEVLQDMSFQEDVAKLAQDANMSVAQFLDWVGQSLWLRLFRCRTCGAYRVALDLD